MRVFRRRRDAGEPRETEPLDEESESAAAAAPQASPSGPYDSESAPADALSRLDLGALLVPLLPGLDVRAEVVPGTPPVIQAVTLVAESVAMTLTVFAAPKSEGIWADVRAELAVSVREGGGRVREAPGDFGPELLAEVPGPAAGQLAPVRFVGIDGPRWFLRATFAGQPGMDAPVPGVLLDALRQTVVERGREAMAVRDALPLRPPPGMDLPPLPVPLPEPPGPPAMPDPFQRPPGSLPGGTPISGA
ncbi:MAG: DUF3710 domain-containing protein [Mycobacteriales bacterium]